MNQHIEGPEISAFLDGALSAADRARVDAHLSFCHSCASKLASLRHMKLVLQSATRKSLPADLALRLERELVHAQSRWTAFSRPALWVPAGTMAAAALMVGFWLHSTRATEEVPLEALLQAHARYSAETLVPEDNLVASNYSDQLPSLYADSSDAELE